MSRRINIGLQTPNSRQPSALTPINQNNRFGLKLDCLYVPALGLNSVNDVSVVNAGATFHADGNYSVADFGTASGSSNPNSVSFGQGFNYSGPFTIFVMVKRTATQSSNYDGIFVKLDGVAAGSFGVLVDPSGSPYVQYTPSGTQYNTVLSLSQLILNQWTFLIGTCDGTTLSLFRDGSLFSAVACSGFPGTNTSPLKLGARSASNCMPMEIAFAGMGRGALSAAAAREFSANPWQVFQGQPRNIFTDSPLFPSKAILLDTPSRTTQPKQSPNVNWSNAITAGLAFAYTPGAGGISPDNVHNYLPYQNSSVNLTVGSFGAGIIPVTGTSWIGYTSVADLNVAGAITIIALCRPSQLTADSAVVSKNASNGGGGDTAPYIFGTSAIGGLSFGRTSVGFRVWQSTSTMVVGKDYVIGVSGAADISVPPAFYVSGIRDATAPVSQYGGGGSGASNGNNDPVRVGNRGDNATPFNGSIYAVFVWNRQLSNAEHASLAANPWQVFK
jgi:hypothetical protein